MSLDFLKKIEADRRTANIRFKGVQAWPVIRVYLAMQKLNGFNVKSDSDFKIKISEAFKGLRHYFGRYDHLFFTNSSVRTEETGKSIDRCIGKLSTLLEKSLVIETPHSYDATRGLPYYEKRVASSLALHGLMALYKKVFLRSPRLEEEAYLQSILQRELPDFNHKEVVRKFWSKYVVYTWLLKIYRPKVVFVVCSYTNHGLILACKRRGIKVVEAQHGLINHAHEGYFYFRKYDQALFPDYLLSYGKFEKEILQKAHSIPAEKVIPVGNFGLENGISRFANKDVFQNIKSNFEYTFCVSGQSHIERELYTTCMGVAEQNPHILILYIPRHRDWAMDDSTEQKEVPSNLKIIRDESIYNIINLSDYHVTCTSSCAYEALALGKRNLLFNIHGLSESYFTDLILDTKNNLLLNDAEEFQQRFSGFAGLDSDRKESPYLVRGYTENLKKVHELI